jgi:hypothetical protein
MNLCRCVKQQKKHWNYPYPSLVQKIVLRYGYSYCTNNKNNFISLLVDTGFFYSAAEIIETEHQGIIYGNIKNNSSTVVAIYAHDISSFDAGKQNQIVNFLIVVVSRHLKMQMQTLERPLYSAWWTYTC